MKDDLTPTPRSIIELLLVALLDVVIDEVST